MRLNVWLLLWGAALVFVAPMLGDDSTPLKFPCAIADYRVKAPTDLRVYCDPRLENKKFEYPVVISESDDQVQRIPGTERPARLAFDSSKDEQWATVTLTDKPLEAGKTYHLFTLPQYPDQGQTKAFAVVAYPFDTKATVSVVGPIDGRKPPPDQVGRSLFALISKVELDKNSFEKGTLKDDVANRPIHATFKAFRLLDEDSPITIGIAEIWAKASEFKTLSTHVTVGGVTNAFAQPVEVPADKLIQLPSAPKDKDSSDVYFKFLNQSGVGAKPGWAADIKFAPQLTGLGSGFYFTPQVLADVGLGTITGNKSTDMIKAGLGVTRFFSGEAIQFTPQASFETDRHGYHQNILFDADAQYFGRHWLNSIQSRNERELAKSSFKNLQAGKKTPDANTIPSKSWGWQLQTYLGTEIGGARSADTVQSSDKATSVVLPTYRIARIRPKVSAMIEYWKFSLTCSITPRYLFTSENVTREEQVPSPKDPAKTIAQIALHQAKGFRPYGEVGISYQLDPPGHYALSVAYKLGSLPPNFDYVNTVQTGLVAKF